MKTRELRTDHGMRTGFSVISLLLSRHGVARVVATISGATVVRKQRLFAISARDGFCEFVASSKTFLAIGPFGDNSEFWLVTEPPEERPQIEVVRSSLNSTLLANS